MDHWIKDLPKREKFSSSIFPSYEFRVGQKLILLTAYYPVLYDTYCVYMKNNDLVMSQFCTCHELTCRDMCKFMTQQDF